MTISGSTLGRPLPSCARTPWPWLLNQAALVVRTSIPHLLSLTSQPGSNARMRTIRQAYLTSNPRHAHTPAMEENNEPYISYSQLTTWLQCGEKYRLTRVVKVEEDPAWYFAGGTAVHAAADAIDHALLGEQS